MKNLRHGDEHGVLFILLPNIGEAAEDEHAHDDHQHQQTQLLVAETLLGYETEKYNKKWIRKKG